jgi:hypothetical protein
MKSLAALLVVATLGTGCFSFAGHGIGEAIEKPRYTPYEPPRDFATEGMIIGGIIDAILLGLWIRSEWPKREPGGCFLGPCSH